MVIDLLILIFFCAFGAIWLLMSLIALELILTLLEDDRK